jgi:hypothetical protein
LSIGHYFRFEIACMRPIEHSRRVAIIECLINQNIMERISS